VAEGVESERELSHLSLLGSPLIQGYLMHRPESIDEFLGNQYPINQAKLG